MLNANDFDSVQAAVNAIPVGGGSVLVPRGVWTDTGTPRYSASGSSTLTLPADRPVRLIGEGSDITILRSSSSSQPIVVAQGDNFLIDGLTVESTAPLPASGVPSRGIVVGRTNAVLNRFAIRDCVIRNTPGYGLYVRGNEAGESTLSIMGHCERIRIVTNKSEGGVWVGPANTTQYFLECSVEGFRGAAVRTQAAEGLTFSACLFEDSLDNATPYVTLDTTNVVVMDRCWFESHGATDTQYFLQLLGTVRAIDVRTTRFVRNDNISNAKVATIEGLSRSVVLANLEVLLNVAPTGTDDIKILNAGSEVALVEGVIAQPANFHPLRVSGSPALSAWLGSSGRVRVPQAAGTGGLLDPANGDLLYNTATNKLDVRVGGAWMGIVTTTP